MDKFLNLTLSGLVTGAIYSVMASGLVLTYTTSGIFNFAHGAIAFTTAYLYYQLHTGLGVPIVPAAGLSVFVFAPLMGLALDRLLLRRLAAAPVYARIVGTIGLVVMLPALAQWVFVTLGMKVFHFDLAGNVASESGVPVPGIGPHPATVFHPLSGVSLDSDQLAVFVMAAVAAAGLWYVIRRTRLGLEMRAVVDRDSLAALRGVDAARTSAAAWVMTTILAGLGGVLIAPLFTLTDYVYTLVVLGSLAVVVLGGLRSIPIAFAGGLGLGIVQNLVAGYSDSVLPDWLSKLSGLNASVPFLLTIVLLLGFGRDRSRRAGSVADDAPRPDHRSGLSPLRRRAPWFVGTVVLLAYALQWIPVGRLQADAYGQTVIAQGLAVSVIFLSFVVVTGMGGMVSLGQVAFVTAGGFGAGWALSRDWGIDVPGIAPGGHLSFVFALLLGGAVAAALGALVAVPVTRLGGVNLALGTLSVAFVLSLVVFSTDAVGNHQLGWAIAAPTLDVPGVNQLVDLVVVGDAPRFDAAQVPMQILLFLGIFGLVTAAIHALQRSSSGRAILAVRSSEVAAEASGVRVNRTKILVFAFAAGIAGLGGVCLGVYSFQVDNSTAPPLVGLYWLALAVLFGIRRPGGALLAGLAFTGGTAVLHWVGTVFPGGAANALLTSVYFLPILSGLGAVSLAQEPDGLLALTGHRRLASQRSKRRARIDTAAALVHRDSAPHEQGSPVIADGTVRRAPAPDQVVAVAGIVAGYGDVEVLHGVDLAVRSGEIVALLGANGAGKSTLCAVVAGTVAPIRGQVWLAGRDITTTPSHRRARDGLILVPEARGVFPGLTVEENLRVLVRDAEARDRAYARFPILGQRRGQVAGLLSGGQQQMLSLAPALADPPAVLIADEPTLGLAPMAAAEVIDAIVELRERGTAIVLVEEHATNARRVADFIAYMELGRIAWCDRREDADIDRLAGEYLGTRSAS
jgi:ABC-type branched-subunit amino acid transport system ATPase component/branched-subunit amino acid ABC-type transport system permease component